MKNNFIFGVNINLFRLKSWILEVPRNENSLIRSLKLVLTFCQKTNIIRNTEPKTPSFAQNWDTKKEGRNKRGAGRFHDGQKIKIHNLEFNIHNFIKSPVDMTVIKKVIQSVAEESSVLLQGKAIAMNVALGRFNLKFKLKNSEF